MKMTTTMILAALLAGCSGIHVATLDAGTDDAGLELDGALCVPPEHDAVELCQRITSIRAREHLSTCEPWLCPWIDHTRTCATPCDCPQPCNYIECLTGLDAAANCAEFRAALDACVVAEGC